MPSINIGAGSILVTVLLSGSICSLNCNESEVIHDCMSGESKTMSKAKRSSPKASFNLFIKTSLL